MHISHFCAIYMYTYMCTLHTQTHTHTNTHTHTHIQTHTTYSHTRKHTQHTHTTYTHGVYSTLLRNFSHGWPLCIRIMKTFPHEIFSHMWHTHINLNMMQYRYTYVCYIIHNSQYTVWASFKHGSGQISTFHSTAAEGRGCLLTLVTMDVINTLIPLHCKQQVISHRTPAGCLME